MPGDVVAATPERRRNGVTYGGKVYRPSDFLGLETSWEAGTGSVRV